MKLYVIDIKGFTELKASRVTDKKLIAKMKVYPVMLMKTNIEKKRLEGYPVMLMKTSDLNQVTP